VCGFAGASIDEGRDAARNQPCPIAITRHGTGVGSVNSDRIQGSIQLTIDQFEHRRMNWRIGRNQSLKSSVFKLVNRPFTDV
jgi:hypothetical protein